MKLIHRIRHPKKLVIMEHEINIKREALEELEDGEPPRLEIADGNHSRSSPTSPPQTQVQSQVQPRPLVNNKDVVESLLLLGREAVLSNESRQRAASVSDLASPETAAASEAFSLRRHSSGSDIHSVNNANPIPKGFGEIGENSAIGGNVTYYQRMRERNNEASKRCRLKRRMKAECMENQASILTSTNRMMKTRISRLEHLSSALKEGVRMIQSGNCACDLTANKVRQTNSEFADDFDKAAGRELSNLEMVSRSRAFRETNNQLVDAVNNVGSSGKLGLNHNNHPGSFVSSSEDDLTSTPPPYSLATPSLKPQALPQMMDPRSFPHHQALTNFNTKNGEVTVTPILNGPAPNFVPILPKSNMNPAATPGFQPRVQTRPISLNVNNVNSVNKGGRTALDILNDTIVKSLSSPPPGSGSGSGKDEQQYNQTPLNLVKIYPSNQQGPNMPKKLILLSASPRNSIESNKSDDSASIVIKKEPESTTEQIQICIAKSDRSQCRGDLLNLNKLTCCLDLVSRKVVKDDDGSSAMERAIIKSRLKIPFWKADEATTFVCGHHRHILVHGVDLAFCAMCSKKKTAKKPGRQGMHTITYRMSLEFYTTSGTVLPIGFAVCEACKERHLKNVDMTGSREVPSNPMMTMSMTIPAPVSVSPETVLPDSSPQQQTNSLSPPLKREASSPLLQRRTPPKIRCLPSSSSTLTQSQQQSNGNDAAIIPVQRSAIVPVTSSGSAGGGNSGGIFAKIGQLNDALHAINPRYQPIGFSITSIESCSPSVLQDAVCATETAVSTLMSVIAPGQESYLWEAIKPKLEEKLGRK